jgi:acyl-coenzyme A thioesterase 13
MDTVPRNKQQEATRKFILEPLDPSLTAHIDGNAPVSIKELPVKWLAIFRSRGNGFCHDIAERVVVTEVSIGPRIENPEKIEGKVVCEVEVRPGKFWLDYEIFIKTHDGCLSLF